jgi:aminoglycoside phosphotransferase (APT) family kinase protein
MSRQDTYYWKCDRPAPFHGTGARTQRAAALETVVAEALALRFHAHVQLSPGKGQGNHLTWLAAVDGKTLFIRVEDGPEGDGYLEMESAVMQVTRSLGIPVPEVLAFDATRSLVPFAWQAMEFVPFPDLNHFHKSGTLNVAQVAHSIGSAVALWQAIRPTGFGPFDASCWRARETLSAFHSTYETYFNLRLDQHLDFLVTNEFLTSKERDGFRGVLAEHRSLLALEGGCLVHKDLALWNILGTGSEVKAFIDFDDAISGDPMDDLSLLACFHDAQFLEHALQGYTSVRPLPGEFRRRFWLHLVRNMIVKSVIRVGAGYFERDADFFLIGNAGTGGSFKAFTRTRLLRALEWLQTDADITVL